MSYMPLVFIATQGAEIILRQKSPIKVINDSHNNCTEFYE